MSSWSIPLDKFAQRAGARLEDVARKVTLDLFSSVVRLSPVDTGRFRANWNVSYGTPDLTVTESTQQGRGATEAAKALTLPVGGVLYLANALPYSLRLENGWSKQAPTGMVKLSVQNFNDYIKAALQK